MYFQKYNPLTQLASPDLECLPGQVQEQDGGQTLLPVRGRQVAYRTAVGKPTVVRLNRMGRRFRSPRTFDCLCSGSHVLSTSAGSSRQLASSRCVSPRRHFCRRIGERRARQAAYVGPCFIEWICGAVALSLLASSSNPLVSLSLDKLLHHGYSRQAALRYKASTSEHDPRRVLRGAASSRLLSAVHRQVTAAVTTLHRRLVGRLLHRVRGTCAA